MTAAQPLGGARTYCAARVRVMLSLLAHLLSGCSAEPHGPGGVLKDGQPLRATPILPAACGDIVVT